jgi:hypothetical protein
MPLMRLTVRTALEDSLAALTTQHLLGTEPDAGGAPTPPDGTKDAGPVAVVAPAASSVGWLVGCYLAIAVGALLSVGVWAWRNPAQFAPAAGISVFAPLYILAQAIERLIDPLNSFVAGKAPDAAGTTADGTPIAAGRSVKKREAVHNVNRAIMRGSSQSAADWQAVVDQIRVNTALLAWTLASVLAMLACGLFGLYMMRAVGFDAVPKWADVVITGLAVGSGTKPLHDLISNLQAAKEGKQDPPEKQAA